MNAKTKKYYAWILAITLVFSIMPLNVCFAKENSNLVVHYDMTHGDEKLKDVTGNGHDADMVNVKDSDFTSGSEGKALNFDATAKYVKIPKGVIQGETFTIESTFKTTTSANHWLWTLGTTVASWPNVKNYLFLNPLSAQGGYVGKVLGGIKNGSTELRCTSNLVPNNDELNTVAAVFNNGNVTFYLNGTATNVIESGYSIQDILTANSASDCMGYIGRSLYSSDPYYKGSLYDFKIYNTALTEEDVKSNYEAGQATYLKLAQENLTVDGIDNVCGNLNLPTNGSYNSTITWESSNPNVISTTGVVTKPSVDATVTLTATISLGGSSVQKVFTANVKSDQGIVDLAKDALTVNNIDDVRGNITLPTTGLSNTQITWKSSNTSVITDTASGNIPAGVVTRQSSDTQVNLTATITLGSISVEKAFTAKVKAKPASITTDKYMFAYFIGQNGPNEEQLYFAGSNDGLNWNELNGGEPVLTSSMGEKGVRDPFIMRSAEGDKFYIIATDLSIYNNGDWGRAQTAGSKSIMIWESTDLVHWSNQRMAKIAKDDAGCTWAPEAFYDSSTGEYIVFWASKVGSDNYAKQRIYYCKTRDFYTFTDPQVWLEESYSVIDCTVIKDNVTGYYYRFTKNESKTYIYLERSKSLMTPFEKVTSWQNIAGAEGPTCYNLNGTNEWILLVDYFGGGGYSPYSIKDLSNPVYTKPAAGTYSLPTKPRHGTVMNITTEEYKNIMSAYGDLTGDLSSIPNVVMQGDDASVFPASLKLGMLGLPETQKTHDIDWNITKDTFAKVGLVTVTGTVKDIPSKTISKEVLVVRPNTRYFVHAATDITKQDSPYYKSLANKTTLLNSQSDQAYDGKWGYTAYDGQMGTSYLGINNSGFYGKNDGSVNPTYKVTLNSGTYTLDSMQYEWWTGPRTTEVHAIYTDGNGKNDDVILGSSTVDKNSRIGMTSGKFTIDKDNTEVTIVFKRTAGDGAVVSYFAIAESSILTGVDTQSDIKVANGTAIDSIGLPKDVNVTIDGSVTTSAAVVWDDGNPKYDGNTEGNYKFTGTLALANDIKNPNELKATINVSVLEGNESPVTTPSAVSIKIEGIEQVGNTLSAKLIGETTTGASVTYKWYSLDNSSSEYVNLIGTGKTYELISKDAGKYVGLIAIYDGKALEPKKTGMIEAAQSTSTDVATTTTTSTSHKHHNSSSTSNNETITNDNQATTNNNKTTTTNNDSNSTVVTEGWNQSSNEWKYIKNGQPATGWNKIGDLWYLMDSKGIMQTGWKQTDSKWYFLKENGSMATGWIQSNNQWYYLQENGEMAIGWVQSNGGWYYLYRNGSMASNTVIDGYKVNENGAWVK